MYSLSTFTSWIKEPLIFTLWSFTRSTLAPMPSIACKSTLISLTFGRFSIVTVSSVIIAAAKIGSAAFFAPPISTSPYKGLPPLITYCSIFHLNKLCPDQGNAHRNFPRHACATINTNTLLYASSQTFVKKILSLIYYSIFSYLLFKLCNFSIKSSTVCSTPSPSSEIHTSAYFSYKGVLSI